MSYIDFNSKAQTYEENGLVQKAAGERLFELIEITPNDDVLDLGCGSGGISRRIAGATRGSVLGVDSSGGMINEARRSNKDIRNLSFMVMDAAELNFSDQFDRIYCNSAFQWFADPARILALCLQSLKPGGLMGIQATATEQYCPQFIYAMNRVAEHPLTSETFRYFKNPWLFLPDRAAYCQLFEKVGFTIEYCQMVIEKTAYSIDQVYDIFKSGAENGYLNQNYYTVEIHEEYIEACRGLIKSSFRELADEQEKMDLVFHRVYLTARKPL